MRYWVYLEGEVPGSFTPEELADMPNMGPTTLVCPAEGEILEKNWRHAGEFPDIAGAMKIRGKPPAIRDPKTGSAPQTIPEGSSGPASTIPQTPVQQGIEAPASCAPHEERPAAPAGHGADEASTPARSGGSADLEGLIDRSSHKLFRHVSELMKELEARRDEHSLVESLQRQLAELRSQLRESRERAAILEDRISVLPTLDETARKAESQAKSLEVSLKGSEDALAELRIKHETSRTEIENFKRRLAEASNDLSIRNRLVDKLNKELTEKELGLARALAVIHRFEEEMGRICHDPEEGSATQAGDKRQPSLPLHSEPEPSPVQGLNPAPQAQPQTPPQTEVRSTPFTKDDPPTSPPPITPPARPVQPEAQNALTRLIKKYFSPEGPHH